MPTHTTTIADHCAALQRVHKLVEHLEAAATLGAFQHALKAAEELVATLRPLATPGDD